MGLSRPRNFKVMLGVIVGVALLCSAMVAAYATTRNSGTPKAADSTSTSKTSTTKNKPLKTTPNAIRLPGYRNLLIFEQPYLRKKSGKNLGKLRFY